MRGLTRGVPVLPTRCTQVLVAPTMPSKLWAVDGVTMARQSRGNEAVFVGRSPKTMDQQKTDPSRFYRKAAIWDCHGDPSSNPAMIEGAAHARAAGVVPRASSHAWRTWVAFAKL